MGDTLTPVCTPGWGNQSWLPPAYSRPLHKLQSMPWDRPSPFAVFRVGNWARPGRNERRKKPIVCPISGLTQECTNSPRRLLAGAWSFYIFSGVRSLNQGLGSNLEAERGKQLWLLGHFFAGERGQIKGGRPPGVGSPLREGGIGCSPLGPESQEGSQQQRAVGRHS